MERGSALLKKGKSRTEGHRTYIVFGVMRGGTSMVAGVMRGLGINMGPDVNAQNHESAEFSGKTPPEMRQALETHNSEHEVWGWKYPNAVDYLDRIWTSIRNPHLICVSRDAVANGRGLNRWHPFGEVQAVHETLLRQQKNLGLIMLRGCPSLMVSYEKAERNKMQFVNELSEWLGVPPNHEAFDFEGFMAAESYKNIEDYKRLNTTDEA